MEINIIVPGEPVPQGRPRFNSLTKSARDPQKSRIYKRQVGFHALKQQPKPLLDAAVSVEINIFRSAPKKITGIKKNGPALEKETLRPITKPDLDNYAKGIIDALSGVIWTDDGLVVELTVRKFYSLKPRAEIKVKEI